MSKNYFSNERTSQQDFLDETDKEEVQRLGGSERASLQQPPFQSRGGLEGSESPLSPDQPRKSIADGAALELELETVGAAAVLAVESESSGARPPDGVRETRLDDGGALQQVSSAAASAGQAPATGLSGVAEQQPPAGEAPQGKAVANGFTVSSGGGPAGNGYVNDAFVGDGGRPPGDGKAGAAADAEAGPAGAEARAQRRRAVRNVLVVSLAFLVHFTAYFGAANLQSSVNADQGLGTESLVTVYAALIVSSFLLPATVIRRLGCKWTLVASMLSYSPYICAQFAASRATLLPAAALVGLGGGPLWCAKCTYLTAAARRFASLAGQRDEHVQVRFFGVFFTLFPLSNVLGNVISSLVLTSGSDAEVASGVLCGANFCPADLEVTANPNLERPPLRQLYILNGVFLACMLAAAGAVALLLDPISSRLEEEDGEARGLRLLTASARLLRDPLHCLVMPISVFFGVTQGFLSADFTQAYVSCSWGIPHIGYVLMCYGAASCLCSAIISWFSQSTGHTPVVVVYLTFYVPIIATLFFWQPDPTVSTAPYFLFVSFWGLTDSAFLVVNALFGILFRGNEKAAYSNFRTGESLGFIASYAYSALLCTHVKLALMAALLAVSAACYCGAEKLARRRAANSFWLQDRQAADGDRKDSYKEKGPAKAAAQ